MALPIGGQIVAEGRPEQAAKVPASYTGQFLVGALIPATSKLGAETCVSSRKLFHARLLCILLQIFVERGQRYA